MAAWNSCKPDIPHNAGILRPIRIVIPPRSMLSPEYPAAVVAGNVETSQAVTNCLFGALGAVMRLTSHKSDKEASHES